MALVPEKTSDILQALQAAAVSDTGCERDLNEDRYAVIEGSAGVTWVVCDGMGGVSGGELAAQLAIDAMRRSLENAEGKTAEVALRAAIYEANRVIVLRRQNPEFSSMGTTIVAAIFDGSEVVIAHAGDSRAYLVRDHGIQSLTTDHTFVQELVDKGQISPEEALDHPQAHILTRCLGASPNLELSVQKFWIWAEPHKQSLDKIVLCSDGLYSLIEDEELGGIISDNSSANSCTMLIDLAIERGGFDNITVAVVPIEGQLRSEPPPASAAIVNKSRKKKKETVEENVKINWGKVILFVLLLSFLSFLATISVIFILASS
jgi:serine/threonine protein phosphatase PrpC